VDPRTWFRMGTARPEPSAIASSRIYTPAALDPIQGAHANHEADGRRAVIRVPCVRSTASSTAVWAVLSVLCRMAVNYRQAPIPLLRLAASRPSCRP